MNRVLISLFAFAFVGGLYADDPKEIPKIKDVETKETKEPPIIEADGTKSVTKKAGEPIYIKLANAKAKVGWKLYPQDRDKFIRIDPAFLISDKVIVLIGKVPGKYYLSYLSFAEETWDEIEIVVTPANGPPPNPGPNPGPTPPNPGPQTELGKKLQAAFDGDTTTLFIKNGAKDSLIALYSAMETHATDKSITTLNDLWTDLERTAALTIPPGGLIPVRKVIGAELKVVMGPRPDEGSPPTPLTEESRAKFAGFCGQVCAALRSIVPPPNPR